MAVDAYLQIDGIKGESQDSTHRDWIECLNVHFGVDQPRSPVTSTSGGHTSARADFDDVVVSKLADLSTPLLLQHCAMGKTNMEVHATKNFGRYWRIDCGRLGPFDQQGRCVNIVHFGGDECRTSTSTSKKTWRPSG
jgi:hypothetical protein